MTRDRHVADVLRKTRDTLATARQGLDDLTGDDPNRRLTGLRNVAVFGHSVTFVLQTMRSIDRAGFNVWYGPIQEAMASDPLLKFFRDLRNEILKEGTPDHTSSLYFEHLDGAQMAALTTNPPPGAKRFFMGDHLGGSGWEIEMPDGTIEKYYVQLPDWLRVQTKLHLPNPPSEHLGKPITDSSLEQVAALFIAYLDKLVTDAEVHFG